MSNASHQRITTNQPTAQATVEIAFRHLTDTLSIYTRYTGSTDYAISKAAVLAVDRLCSTFLMSVQDGLTLHVNEHGSILSRYRTALNEGLQMLERFPDEQAFKGKVMANQLRGTLSFLVGEANRNNNSKGLDFRIKSCSELESCFLIRASARSFLSSESLRKNPARWTWAAFYPVDPTVYNAVLELPSSVHPVDRGEQAVNDDGDYAMVYSVVKGSKLLEKTLAELLEGRPSIWDDLQKALARDNVTDLSSSYELILRQAVEKKRLPLRFRIHEMSIEEFQFHFDESSGTIKGQVAALTRGNHLSEQDVLRAYSWTPPRGRSAIHQSGLLTIQSRKAE